MRLTKFVPVVLAACALSATIPIVWGQEGAKKESLVFGEAKPDAHGYVSLFDGKSLANWDGNPDFWRVEDGAIVGQTTKEKVTKGNTFLIWKGGQPGDFTLRAKFKIEGEKANSGIQYRSKDKGKWVVNGYQADIDGSPTGGYIGILYEEGGRGILAQRGTTVSIPPGVGGKDKAVKPQVEKENKAAASDAILKSLKHGDWNDYEVIAQGNHLVQKINGHVTVDVTDNDPEKGAKSGILALQLHAGPPMKVAFKDIVIKEGK
jgi:hypothetical protein